MKKKYIYITLIIFIISALYVIAEKFIIKEQYFIYYKSDINFENIDTHGGEVHTVFNDYLIPSNGKMMFTNMVVISITEHNLNKLSKDQNIIKTTKKNNLEPGDEGGIDTGF